MPTGRVDFFLAGRGYGFIKADDGGPDLFVHQSSLDASGLDSLTKGQPVSFDRQLDKRRPNRFEAINLRIVSPAEN
jgi:cold shock protein